MVDGAAKERMYESIRELFVKSEDLETQLQEVGSEERVCVQSNCFKCAFKHCYFYGIKFFENER